MPVNIIFLLRLSLLKSTNHACEMVHVYAKLMEECLRHSMNQSYILVASN